MCMERSTFLFSTFKMRYSETCVQNCLFLLQTVLLMNETGFGNRLHQHFYFWAGDLVPLVVKDCRSRELIITTIISIERVIRTQHDMKTVGARWRMGIQEWKPETRASTNERRRCGDGRSPKSIPHVPRRFPDRHHSYRIPAS